jgi:hypothetical protein
MAFTAIGPSYADDPPLPTPVGRVIWVKGTLRAVMDNNEERKLQKMSVIYLKDTLITEPGSQAQIAFTDNTLMTFREDTKFVVAEYQYKPAAKGKSVGKYLMNLIQGGFRTITGLIAKKNPDDYQINTPVATIGVRGTDYVVYFKNGQTYIGYNSGTPCISSKDKSSKLCLDKKVKYGLVDGEGAAPVPLSMRPPVFDQQLDIIPATISQFGGSAGSSGGSSRPMYGTINSFCIQ